MVPYYTTYIGAVSFGYYGYGPVRDFLILETPVARGRWHHCADRNRLTHLRNGTTGTYHRARHLRLRALAPSPLAQSPSTPLTNIRPPERKQHHEMT